LPISIIFWFLMICWIISKFVTWRGVDGPYGPYLLIGSDVMILILFFLLGWHDFGFIVQSG